MELEMPLPAETTLISTITNNFDRIRRKRIKNSLLYQTNRKSAGRRYADSDVWPLGDASVASVKIDTNMQKLT